MSDVINILQDIFSEGFDVRFLFSLVSEGVACLHSDLPRCVSTFDDALVIKWCGCD